MVAWACMISEQLHVKQFKKMKMCIYSRWRQALTGTLIILVKKHFVTDRGRSSVVLLHYSHLWWRCINYWLLKPELEAWSLTLSCSPSTVPCPPWCSNSINTLTYYECPNFTAMSIHFWPLCSLLLQSDQTYCWASPLTFPSILKPAIVTGIAVDRQCIEECHVS